jgi:hypothetical protein
MLAGSGTTGTLIVEQGVISPGMGQNDARRGTLHVNGHYLQQTQNATATALLWIDVSNKGYDRLEISGSAIISSTGGVQFRLNSPDGSMKPGEYEILRAAMGITGSFAPGTMVVAESLTLKPANPENPMTVRTNPDSSQSLILTLQQQSFVVEGLTAGQARVGEYLIIYTKTAPSSAWSPGIRWWE